MKIHPRYFIVEKAKSELAMHVAKTMDTIDGNDAEALTVNEWLQVLNDVFHGQIGSIIKCEIRVERHGDENKRVNVSYDEKEEDSNHGT